LPLLQNEPLWLTFEDISQLHQAGLDRFGGLYGVRDAGAIQSAIDSPTNLFLHEALDDPIALAVRYCARLCGNHGFMDGNKRVASAAMLEFLAINGLSVETNDTINDDGETELSLIIKSLAAHECSEDDLYTFIEERASYTDQIDTSGELSEIHTSGGPSLA
jgi:death-on-curing protein